jgi:hypothetical protein
MAVTQRPKERLVLSLRWTGRVIGFLGGVLMVSVLLEEWGSMTPGAWGVVTWGIAMLIGVGLTFWHDWIGGLELFVLGSWLTVQVVLEMQPAEAFLFFGLPFVLAGLLLLAASFVAWYRSDEREPTGAI